MQSPSERLAEAKGVSVERPAKLERPCRALVHSVEGASIMSAEDHKDVPPPVQKRAPERELEKELRQSPHDLDKKADVGSDESMDASDPPAAAQPGQSDEPVPSSGFPE
jgi:hypothetical protein